MARLLIALLFASSLFAQQRRLLIISIDGMDHRYLHEADKLGLKIPTLRRLASEGALAEGVLGVVPTVTWPSHTTMITGMMPSRHGILTNDQPGQPGQRWWYTTFLKARTLWQAAREKKLKVAAVYWPVMVGADIEWNIPEFWIDRAHAIRFAPIAQHSTPGLIDRISRTYPSFGVSQWSDRSALVATRFLLEQEKPELTLVHIADLDEEQHETGAFSRQARATIEYQDELLKWMLEALPPQTVVAIVSDHGFESNDQMFRPKTVVPEVQVKEGLVGATSQQDAAQLRKMVGGPAIAREVPMEEVRRMAPELASWVAAFETARNITVSAATNGPALSDGDHHGVHGLWPTRPGYRASFLLWGPGVKPQQMSEISMLDEGPTFAEILGVTLPDTQGKSLWPRLR